MSRWPQLWSILVLETSRAVKRTGDTQAETGYVDKPELTVLQLLEKQISTVITKPREERKEVKAKNKDKQRKTEAKKEKTEAMTEKKAKSKGEKPKGKENKGKEPKAKENAEGNAERGDKAEKKRGRRMEKMRKQQSLLRMVHTGQGHGMISSGPLTPILDESPRNSLLLSCPSSGNNSPAPVKTISPIKWNQSDSEVRKYKFKQVPGPLTNIISERPVFFTKIEKSKLSV